MEVSVSADVPLAKLYSSKYVEKPSDNSQWHPQTLMIGGVEGSKTALLDMFWAPLSLRSEAFLYLSDSFSRRKILRSWTSTLRRSEKFG